MEIKLKNIIREYDIIEQEFEYAGVKGSAELLGWQIIAFYRNENLHKWVALLFEQVTNVELINISNIILESIGFNVKIFDKREKIEQYYGEADFIDDVYEDMIRYNYMISSNHFISFGLKCDKLISLEIIYDEEIIREVVEVRKNN